MALLKGNGRSNITPFIWDNFFNQVQFNGDNMFTGTGNSLPAVNIRETPESFQVEMAAPGMEKSDFKFRPEGSGLTISSEKQKKTEDAAPENYSGKEFSYQLFYRTFHLPKEVANADQIQAKYQNGLLPLEIPRAERCKTKASATYSNSIMPAHIITKST